MKLQFLGTAAAEGVPAMYCQCETCKEIRRRGEKEFHTRSQFLIDGCVGIDFPPDAYYHSLRFGVDLAAIEYLLISHSHMDHFYAHDFILRGYKYTSPVSGKLRIYGNAEVKKVYEECTRRELREDVGAQIEVIEVSSFTPFFIGREGEYKVIALPAQHSKVETAFVYLIENKGKTYLHLTDTGRLPKESLEFLSTHFKDRAPLDFVTFDCTFLFYTAGEVSRHMGLGDNKAMQEFFEQNGIANKHTVYAITHYSHNSAPFSERLKEAENAYGYIAAYDDLTIEI